MNKFAHLDDRSLLKISGREAQTFLQNLVTCNIDGLQEGQATFGALLTPQGKILFDFFVLREDESFILEVTTSERDNLAKRLTFYKLRADVSIEADPRAVYWTHSAEADEGFIDPRLDILGRRIYTVDRETDLNAEEYDRNRIALAIPESGKDFELASLYPHDVFMDLFPNAGVDFSKGCFVGQEVVARMQHKGGIKRRPVALAPHSLEQIQDPPLLPAQGTSITCDDRELGVMGSSLCDKGICQGIGIVRIDRLERAEATDQDILAGKTPVSVSRPEKRYQADHGWRK